MNENMIQMVPMESTPWMPEVYRWGIEVIKLIQQIENPGLTALTKFISVMGSAYFFIPVILFIFWWMDEKRGLLFGILTIVSGWINVFAKEVLQHPRPFNLEPSLGLVFVPGYGAPSGHAKLSLTFWLAMAAWLSHLWMEKKQHFLTSRSFVWAFSILIILLVGFTRLYLGVHFPTDIFAGWLLGLIILAIWLIPGPSLMNRLAQAGLRAQNISAAVIALLMNALLPEDKTLPALFLGFCIGYNLMKHRFPFSAQGEISEKKPGINIMLFRCLTGFIGMAVIFLASRLIFPGEGSLFGNITLWGRDSPFYDIGHFFRFGLLGFWVSAGAPYLFKAMGLASTVKKADES